MSDRETYGKTMVGAGTGGGTSIGKWIVGAVVVGGAVLWAKHQADQIGRLSAAANLPQPSFTDDLRSDARALTSRAGAAFHGLSQRLRGGSKESV